MSPKKVSILGVAVLALVTLVGLSGQIVETNDKGFYQIKQAAVTGEMTVYNSSGMYLQNFGKVHTYKLSDTYFFDGTEGSEPITVRFQDGGTAKISGSLKYRLSSSTKDQMRIHEDFRSDAAIKNNLIGPIIKESLKQSSPHMNAEESYSTGRSKFTSLVEDQVTKGIFKTVSQKIRRKDTEGNFFIDTFIEIETDKNGQFVVEKASTLLDYNIEVIRFVITDIDYDETIDRLISMKKDAEQRKVVARANAEKAKQDAITAREEGKAKIAIAKAEEEEKKIRSVTQALKEKEVAELKASKEKLVAELNAERDFQVAILERKKASEQAGARIELAQAEAKKNTLLVKAGLTPLESATIDMNTKIGVARELSKINLPQTFIGAGGGTNGGINPFTAIGLESLININEKMSGKKK